MHPLITVIGPIGSGKTTVCHTLAKSLNLPLIDADLFEDNPFLAPFIKDPSRWAFTVELFFTVKRLKKLHELNKLLTKSPIIVDSGLIMSHIYTQNQHQQGHLTADEWRFYQEIIADYQTNLPKSDIILTLQAKPTTQLSRIKARGRDFEADYTLDYLTQVTTRLDEYIANLHHQKSDTHILTFDTEVHNPTTPQGGSVLTSLLSPYLP